MLSLVHRSPFRPVFLVFLLVLSGSISAVRAAAPTPTPTPTPGQLDTTFVPAPGTNDAVNVVIPQPDGKVIAAGRRRERLRVALFPLAIPSHIKTLLSSGRLTGVGLWDLCGLADFVYAEKPSFEVDPDYATAGAAS